MPKTKKLEKQYSSSPDKSTGGYGELCNRRLSIRIHPFQLRQRRVKKCCMFCEGPNKQVLSYSRCHQITSKNKARKTIPKPSVPSFNRFPANILKNKARKTMFKPQVRSHTSEDNRESCIVLASTPKTSAIIEFSDQDRSHTSEDNREGSIVLASTPRTSAIMQSSDQVKSHTSEDNRLSSIVLVSTPETSAIMQSSEQDPTSTDSGRTSGNITVLLSSFKSSAGSESSDKVRTYTTEDSRESSIVLVSTPETSVIMESSNQEHRRRALSRRTLVAPRYKTIRNTARKTVKCSTLIINPIKIGKEACSKPVISHTVDRSSWTDSDRSSSMPSVLSSGTEYTEDSTKSYQMTPPPSFCIPGSHPLDLSISDYLLNDDDDVITHHKDKQVPSWSIGIPFKELVVKQWAPDISDNISNPNYMEAREIFGNLDIEPYEKFGFTDDSLFRERTSSIIWDKSDSDPEEEDQSQSQSPKESIERSKSLPISSDPDAEDKILTADLDMSDDYNCHSPIIIRISSSSSSSSTP